MRRLIDKHIVLGTLLLSLFSTYSLAGIKKAYQYKDQVAKSNDTVLYQSFFECFPSSFSDFVDRYENLKSPLSVKYVSYLKTFEKSFDYVEDYAWIEKLISLSKGAKWNADAVDLLQRILKYRFAMKPDLFAVALEEKNQEDRYDFFYFYLDTMHPAYTELPKELAVLKPELREIALEAMNDVNNKYK